jgi:hypothetical protein
MNDGTHGCNQSHSAGYNHHAERRFHAGLFGAVCSGLCLRVAARAATPAEDRDFSSAERTFKDGLFERAEGNSRSLSKVSGFAAFARGCFPSGPFALERQKTNSEPKPALSAVVSLLAPTRAAGAGGSYATDRPQFHSGDYEAAGSFAQLMDYADSPLVLNASYAEASPGINPGIVQGDRTPQRRRARFNARPKHD